LIISILWGIYSRQIKWKPYIHKPFSLASKTKSVFCVPTELTTMKVCENTIQGFPNLYYESFRFGKSFLSLPKNPVNHGLSLQPYYFQTDVRCSVFFFFKNSTICSAVISFNSLLILSRIERRSVSIDLSFFISLVSIF